MAAMTGFGHAAMAMMRDAVRTEELGDTLAALHAGLAREGWRAGAARDLLPRALPLAASLCPAARHDWLHGLRVAWSIGALDDPAAGAAALALAERWCDWPLVDALCAARSRLLGAGADIGPDATCAWIVALFRTGRSDAALQHCRRRMLSHPHEDWPERLHSTMGAWQCFVDARGPAIAGDGLRLEPLGHQHQADFAWQYHDPQIAALCCLPHFADDAQWHAWLDRCWRYGDQRLYAVLHPEWGFVGSVSLIECVVGHARVGFFYYWFGPDFQGCGLGPRAVRLLLAHARDTRGLHSCHAKVFDGNRRSRRALEKLGFRALPVRGIPPFDGETFYRLGLDRDADAEPVQAVHELRLLLEGMDAETRLAAPLLARSVCGPARAHAA